MTAAVTANGTQLVTADVAIVGAGIIGIAAAYKLQEEGRSVLLIDRGHCRRSELRQCRRFAFSECCRWHPGHLRKLPKWLIDPLGPLSIPPAYLAAITPWLVRFWRAGWRDRCRGRHAAQGALMRWRLPRWQPCRRGQASRAGAFRRCAGTL